MKVNAELVKSLFASPEFVGQNEKAILLAGETLYRAKISGKRYYRRSNSEMFVSVTTLLDCTMPPTYGIRGWREEKAAELGSAKAAAVLLQFYADYGTLLHIAITNYVRECYIDWDELPYWCNAELKKVGFVEGGSLDLAAMELQKDIASLIEFLTDYNCKVLAVELPVFGYLFGNGVGTCIDLVVEKDCFLYTEATPIEARKREKAIINLKSGKNGFSDYYILQLMLESRLFNALYSDVVGYEIDTICNLAPKDWREDKPTYHFKDQTKDAVELNPYLDLLIGVGKYCNGRKSIYATPETKVPIFTGKTLIGQSCKPNIGLKLISEVWQKEFDLRIEKQKVGGAA